jgi:hypothetical protein
MGFPFLLPDFAALRARVDSDASVWKKCPGSVDRDMFKIIYSLNVRNCAQPK